MCYVLSALPMLSLASARLAVGLTLGITSGMASATAAHDPLVTTENGTFKGVIDANGAPIRIFRGIPYAAAPVGKLRWREPQAVASWPGIREATQFGPRCMQQPLFSDMRFRSPGVSEDCLYLNVWAPAKLKQSQQHKLPVLVYVYGGGFMAGDSSENRYDGAALARRGIIVVTMNYRLGVFGFFSHPELTQESPHRVTTVCSIKQPHWLGCDATYPRSEGTHTISPLAASPPVQCRLARSWHRRCHATK